MRDPGGVHHPRGLQLDLLLAQPAEQRDPVAEEHVRDVNLELFEQSGLDELLNRVRAARDGDVLVARGCPRRFESALDAVRTNVNVMSSWTFGSRASCVSTNTGL